MKENELTTRIQEAENKAEVSALWILVSFLKAAGASKNLTRRKVTLAPDHERCCFMIGDIYNVIGLDEDCTGRTHTIVTSSDQVSPETQCFLSLHDMFAPNVSAHRNHKEGANSK